MLLYLCSESPITFPPLILSKTPFFSVIRPDLTRISESDHENQAASHNEWFHRVLCLNLHVCLNCNATSGETFDRVEILNGGHRADEFECEVIREKAWKNDGNQMVNPCVIESPSISSTKNVLNRHWWPFHRLTFLRKESNF